MDRKSEVRSMTQILIDNYMLKDNQDNQQQNFPFVLVDMTTDQISYKASGYTDSFRLVLSIFSLDRNGVVKFPETPNEIWYLNHESEKLWKYQLPPLNF